MDSLYQASVKKSETDLLIDQLKETLHYLTVQNKVDAFAMTGQHAQQVGLLFMLVDAVPCWLLCGACSKGQLVLPLGSAPPMPL